MELTEQQKLEILCAYLPYGVEVSDIHTLSYSSGIGSIGHILTTKSSVYKIRLRHPDDMTEEEFDTLCRTMYFPDSMDLSYFIAGMYGMNLTIKEFKDCLRYLHSIHIDTFGAIEAGWAVRKNINEKGE